MSENQNRQRSTDYFLPPRRKLVMAPEGRHIMAVFRRRQFSEEKGICHMTKATITKLPDPSGFSPDPLTEVLRTGARRLIEQAVEAELTALLASHAGEQTEGGRSRLVRHGHLPEREVMTGIGPVPVKVPRLRDRATGAEKIRFTSAILPPYLRKAKSVEELLPWLYLKGISTGDFQESLAALLGPNAAGLSSTTISRLKAVWWDEYERWQRRDLGARRIVYIWADGVYFQPRMAEEKQCVLVLIGADEWGHKEVLGLADGYRESTQSWRCQRRLNFPQKCRSKIPQVPGTVISRAGDRPSRFSAAAHGVWVAAAA
jgi:putative transposase